MADDHERGRGRTRDRARRARTRRRDRRSLGSGRRPSLETALGLGDVEATAASGSTLIGTVRYHRSALALLRVLAARLRDADRKRLEFPTLDTLGRGAYRPQELGESFGREAADGIEVELPLSQE